MTGVYLLLIVLGAATAFGLWRRSTDGRMRAVAGAPVSAAPTATRVAPPAAGPDEPAGASVADDSEPLLVEGHPIEVTDHTVIGEVEILAEVDLGAPLGEQATLLQFSSAFCSPCRATRVVLADVAGMVSGVVHIEVDAESHLDLVRELDVTRTPTVLVLDRTGRIRSRATGAPRKADVIAALGQVV